ncbi:hypothetical protein HYT54_03090 [Candidatus Woesearchaeota archaeon]|nr:hypothetical protein [Candidatus Woesearchaeota archaeon]
MDTESFKDLFQTHPQKLSQAFIKLSEGDWKAIDGDLEHFLERAQAVYKIPQEILLKELEAVKKNIDEGIEADYVPYLDPIE